MAHDVVSVRLQSNGKYWQAVWSGSDGQRVVRSLGSKAKLSKRAAKNKCDELVVGIAVNPTMRDRRTCPTLEDWCARYLELRPDLRASTVVLLQETIAYLTRFFGADVRIDRISKSAASDWRAWLAKQPGRRLDDQGALLPMSEATVCKHVRAAKTIFRLAVEEEVLPLNPFGRLKSTAPPPEKDWAELTDDMIARLIDAAPDPGWKVLIALCAYAGLRCGEALLVERRHIQWSRNRLRVPPMKTRTRDTLLCKELRAILRANLPAITGGPIAAVPTGNLHRDLEAIIRTAGFEPWSDPFHTLRRWRATSWRRTYPDYVVDAWLGHGPEVARAHYVRVEEAFFRDSSEVPSYEG